VADSPSDGVIPLDATVGSLDQLEEAAPFASAADVPVRVSITGDAVPDPAAMGLAEDLSLLIQGFMQRPASAAQERTRTEAPRLSGPAVDIQFGLHGLQLEPEAEDELQHLIRELVRDRVARAETAE
jgi:hypothetical protein